MATRKVNLPPGFELDPTENLPPGFEIDAAPPAQPPMGQFTQNTLADYKANIQGNAELAAYAFPPLAAMKAAQGTNIYDPQRLKAMGTGMVQGVKQLPGQILNSVIHPIDSFYERPLTTLLDIGSVVSGGSAVAKAGGRMLKPIVKGAGRQVESLTGSAPGSLEAAYKDPTLIGAKGKKAVQELYKEAKASSGGGFRQSLKEIPEKKEFVNKALELAKKGDLTPAEALEARKTLDGVRKQVAAPFFEDARETFDKIAKTAFEKGDAAYKRAVQAESLRNLVPQNKYGGASAFKSALIGIASNFGPVGKVVGAAMSPVAAGVTATGAGMASRAAGKLAKLIPSVPGTIAKEVSKKVLTEDKAREYVKKAKKANPGKSIEEIREMARTQAAKDGWEISE